MDRKTAPSNELESDLPEVTMDERVEVVQCCVKPCGVAYRIARQKDTRNAGNFADIIMRQPADAPPGRPPHGYPPRARAAHPPSPTSPEEYS